MKFSSLIYLIPSLLQLDEARYQKGIPYILNFFMNNEGKIKDTTLEFLEKDFPEYHEYALKYIEEQKKQS